MVVVVVVVMMLEVVAILLGNEDGANDYRGWAPEQDGGVKLPLAGAVDELASAAAPRAITARRSAAA